MMIMINILWLSLPSFKVAVPEWTGRWRSIVKPSPCLHAKCAPVTVPFKIKASNMKLWTDWVLVCSSDGFTLWMQPHTISLSRRSMSCRQYTPPPLLPNVIGLMYFHSHRLQVISMSSITARLATFSPPVTSCVSITPWTGKNLNSAFSNC